MKLTKEAEALICFLYKTYLEKVGNGESKMDARDFDEDFNQIVESKLKWQHGDFVVALTEITSKKLVKQDIIGGVELTDDAIIYMQNRFPNGLKQVVETFSTLAGIVSGAYGAFKG